MGLELNFCLHLINRSVCCILDMLDFRYTRKNQEIMIDTKAKVFLMGLAICQASMIKTH